MLEDALAGLTLPDGMTLDTLVAENNDPMLLAQEIKSPEARDYTYASLYSLAYCDRELSEPEQVLLATLRGAWNIQKSEEDGLRRALDVSNKVDRPAGPSQDEVPDEKKREAAFNRLLTKYCVLTGLTGAIPVPLVPDLLVVPIQVKMVYDVGSLFGQKIDKKTVQLMFETLGVGTGARIGISALSKLVPGWGSVVGATSSFATTFALGKVAQIYFRSQGQTSIESLKTMFQEQRERGKEEYQKQKPALDEAQKTHAQTLRQLAFDLQAGKITQEEYEQKVDALP
jgi:uncharacterized protein (DUF697 family)